MKRSRSVRENNTYVVETKMRKTIPIALGALLIATSTNQMASAADRYVRKAECASLPSTQRARNAYGAVGWPAATESELEYWRGRGISAPAGR